MNRLSHTEVNIPVAENRSDRGSVVTAREQSVTAGNKMFELGGNAVDAAVAAALVAGVIEPTETTLAGCGFMLIQHPTEGQISVDFGPIAPLSAHETMFEVDTNAASSNVLGLAPVVDNANVSGPRASGVPRTLYSILEAQSRWGVLGREAVMQPAIEVAEVGFSADAWFVLNALQDVEVLKKDPVASNIFLNDKGLPIGSDSAYSYGLSVARAPLVPQHLLAETLKRIAEVGHEDLISGKTADLLTKTFEELGMELSAEDLKRMPPRIEKPKTMNFNGQTVAVAGAPGGGLTVLQALNTWQKLTDSKPNMNRDEEILMLARVLRHTFADRYYWLADPEVKDVPVDDLLSDEHAQEIADICVNEPWQTEEEGMAPWIEFAGKALHLPGEAASKIEPWKPETATEPSSGTTHVSAADSDGLVVAITHTAANHFGSGVVCPRTGLLFDSSMAWFNAMPGAANSIVAGARPVANMGPALVVDDETGKAWAIGASGGRRIISAVFQLVINIAQKGMNAKEALAEPRIDASGSNIVIHQKDADFVEGLHELNAIIVPQQPVAFELDFARANIAQYMPETLVVTAIDGRAYGL